MIFIKKTDPYFIFKKTNKNSTCSEKLLDLISVISNLMKNISTELIETNQTQLIELFRMFWFICVVFGFDDVENNVSYENIASIALKSPVLINRDSTNFPHDFMEKISKAIFF